MALLVCAGSTTRMAQVSGTQGASSLQTLRGRRRVLSALNSQHNKKLQPGSSALDQSCCETMEAGKPTTSPCFVQSKPQNWCRDLSSAAKPNTRRRLVLRGGILFLRSMASLNSPKFLLFRQGCWLGKTSSDHGKLYSLTEHVSSTLSTLALLKHWALCLQPKYLRVYNPTHIHEEIIWPCTVCVFLHKTQHRFCLCLR